MRAAGPLLALTLCACGAPGLALDPHPGPYDRLPDTERDALWEARQALDDGDPGRAEALLEGVVRRVPAHLATRTLLQEVELGLLAEGRAVGEIAPPEDPARAVETLEAAYLARAEADPSPVSLVLAARLAPDEDSALALLARAEEFDPACIWVPYARAFWLFSLRRFPEAREAVARARELDPGHLPTLRLFASMLASAGETQLAIKALTAWLERTRSDPLVPRARRAEALADLAALLVLDGREERALELLDEFDADRLEDPSRVALVRAAALQGRGDLDLALAAAREARKRGAKSLLPLVQEAILISQSTDDHGAERAVWERLLAEAARERTRARERRAGAPAVARAPGVDFQSLLIQLMAHTRLAELRRSEPGIADGRRP